MYSRLALLLLLGASGCSLRFNDKVTQPVHKVSTGTACLSQAGDIVEKFTRGTLSEEAHDEFYACAAKAVKKFSDHTVGRHEDSFAADEIGAFLTRAFLRGKTIPPGLLREAMAAKQALIGGPGDRVSRRDLERLVEVLGKLKNFTGKIRPFMPLTAESFRERGFSSEQVEEILLDFRAASERLGTALRAGQGVHRFDQLSGFARELGAFLHGEEVPAGHWSTQVSRYLPVLRQAKSVLLSGSAEEIAQGDWARVYFLAPRLFSSYLRVLYYSRSPWSLARGTDLRILEKLNLEFMLVFRQVIEQRPGRAITSEEVDSLIQALSEQGLLRCRPETARQFVQVIFGKLLGSSRESRFVVTRESLSRLNENLVYAFEGLRATEALYRARFGNGFEKGSLMPAEIASVPESVLLDATWRRDAISQQAVQGVRDTAADLRVAFSEKQFGVVIPKDGEAPLPFLHMVKAVGLRALNRLLLQAYGDKDKLSPSQLDSFLNEVFPILVEYGIVDEKMRLTINKRVTEASLFLFSSDGDRSLTMTESLELEALLLSTLERAPELHKKIAAHCEGDPKLIEEACYREKFSLYAPEIWSYLPGLSEYMAARDLEGRKDVLFDSMARFLRKGREGAPFSVSDSQSYVLLPYYMELLFYRFDSNRDGFLDNAEAKLAYPVFEPFIAEKAAAKGFTNPKDHTAIYNFLLANRMLPTEGKWSFMLRRYLIGDKSFRNDRGHVIGIFEKLLSL